MKATDEVVKTKVCSKCGESFPATVEFFYKDKTRLLLFRPDCKSCVKYRNKVYQEANKDKKKAYDKEYSESKKDKIAARAKEYYEANKDTIASRGKNYREKNKDTIAARRKAYDKEYRKKNKDKIKESRDASKDKAKEYRKKNSEKLSAITKAYYGLNKGKIASRAKSRSEAPAKYTIASRVLIIADGARLGLNGEIVVNCAYCGKEIAPTYRAVKARMSALNGTVSGEQRLYCHGKGCRDACPTFNQQKWPKGFKKASSRESNPVLRQLVFKRDNYECQKCGSTESLHCHHVVPARQNPMTANDPSACTTYCKSCHKEVHKQDGCKYHELRCDAVKAD